MILGQLLHLGWVLTHNLLGFLPSACLVFMLANSESNLSLNFSFTLNTSFLDFSVCHFETGTVFEPKSIVLPLTVLLYLMSDPSFGVGILPYCFNWNVGVYAEAHVICNYRNPVI